MESHDDTGGARDEFSAREATGGSSQPPQHVDEPQSKVALLSDQLSRPSSLIQQSLARRSEESGGTEQGAATEGVSAKQSAHTAQIQREGAPQRRYEQADAP